MEEKMIPSGEKAQAAALAAAAAATTTATAPSSSLHFPLLESFGFGCSHFSVVVITIAWAQ